MNFLIFVVLSFTICTENINIFLFQILLIYILLLVVLVPYSVQFVVSFVTAATQAVTAGWILGPPTQLSTLYTRSLYFKYNNTVYICVKCRKKVFLYSANLFFCLFQVTARKILTIFYIHAWIKQIELDSWSYSQTFLCPIISLGSLLKFRLVCLSTNYKKVWGRGASYRTKQKQKPYLDKTAKRLYKLLVGCNKH